MKTKMNIFEACVLSTMLSASETWTLYAKQERRLDQFLQRSLRNILGIKWEDRVTHVDVLERIGLDSIQTILAVRRLR